MVKPTNQESTVIKKDSLLLTVLKRRGHTMPWGATWRSTRVGQEAEKVRGKHVQEPLLWFPEEIMDKEG